MKSKNIVAFFITLILVSCASVSTQVPTVEIVTTSTSLPQTPIEPELTLTQTLSPTELSTTSSPQVTERLCTPEDFNSSSKSTDLNNVETLIGLRPNRDWLPAAGWEESIGIYNPESNYSVEGFRSANQHLYILEKPVCRYGENGRYGLSEIVDFIWIPSLEADEIIIQSPDLEFCCFLQPTILDRLEFRFEWFALSECNESLPTAIMIAKYELTGLPAKITVGDGYNLPVRIIKGWLPNIKAEEFEDLPTENISCMISFMGG
jgi:hypothetical protein